jgi:hypothetical protein
MTHRGAVEARRKGLARAVARVHLEPSNTADFTLYMVTIIEIYSVKTADEPRDGRRLAGARLSLSDDPHSNAHKYTYDYSCY